MCARALIVVCVCVCLCVCVCARVRASRALARGLVSYWDYGLGGRGNERFGCVTHHTQPNPQQPDQPDPTDPSHQLTNNTQHNNI